MIYFISIFAFFFTTLSSCSDFKNIIELSSFGHSLEEASRGQVVIKDPTGNVLVNGVMGFQVHDSFVFGWSKNTIAGKYFLVDMKRNKVSTYFKLEALNKKLAANRIEALSMDSEITYWDIKEKGKRSVAEFLAQ